MLRLDKGEIKMDNKKYIDIDEQKKIQLEMLKEIRDICDEAGLMYFLGGGTLLGAVRHKGYIPWDDDIDLMMPREDYNKLLKIFNEKCNGKSKLLYYGNLKEYYYPYAKVVNTETRLVELDCRNLDEMGVFIDIFPIDFLPEDDKKIKKIFNKFKFLYRIIATYQLKNLESVTTNKFKLILKKITLPILENR